MIYKEYGKSGKKVSAIGFGGMRFPKKDNGYDMEYCAEMVREANRLGINYFDTAPFYNDNKSEEIFGRAFKDMPGEFYVSTKCASWDASELRHSLERSLKRMNVDKIDFFHIWCVLDMDDYAKRMKPGGPYDELVKARSEGLVDHICISTHCTGDEIALIADEGMFEGITLGYNVINYKFRQPGIKAAHRNNIAVVTMNPLGGGLIPDNKDYFSYITDEETADPVRAAIRFNASHPEITVVLTGMDSIGHVRYNAEHFDISPAFVEKTREKADALTGDDLNKLCTGCRYCEHCPRGIPVSKFMLAYNKRILKDDEDVKSTIRNHWRIPPELVDKCIECGICESKCTQHLPIIERLKHISSLYK